jgi:hypothetical protein
MKVSVFLNPGVLPVARRPSSMSDWDANGEPVPVVTDTSGGDAGAPEPTAGTVEDATGLVELVDELERTLAELRAAVDEGPPRRRRDGPTLPEPPNPRELLRFTETYTIPTLVALLEAAIRALELLAGAIRLLDGRDPRPSEAHGSGGSGILTDVSTVARDRAAEEAAERGREALDRVDDALVELQRAYEGEPPDEDARRLLGDARDLRAEIDDRLAASDPGDDERDRSADGADAPTVDVDAELASLKEQAGRDGANASGDGDERED